VLVAVPPAKGEPYKDFLFVVFESQRLPWHESHMIIRGLLVDRSEAIGVESFTHKKER
jgi:hypothetical protein